MAFKMGRGVIEFLLRDQHLKRGIAKAQATLKTMQASMQVASRWARNLLMAMGAGFFYIVKTASSAQETLSKFRAVFKEQSKAASAFARDLASAVNRAEIDIKSWLSTLQDTFVPMGFARSKARLFSQQLVKLAIDLASFNDTADADVIRDLQSAIVGNHETMRKYGVIIMQLTLDQELLRMGFKGGAKAATEQAKAQARLNIIMAGTADAQGDAVRTAREFANTWKGLIASITTAAARLGTLLLPGLTDLVSTGREAIEVIGSLSKEELRELLNIAGRVGKVLIGIWIAPALLGAVASLIALMGKLRAAILSIKAVSTTVASSITVGLVVALAALAAGYAKVAAEAARAYGQMFKIALMSRTSGRLKRDLTRAEKQLARAETPEGQLAGLRRVVSLRERIVDMAREEQAAAEKQKRDAEDITFGEMLWVQNMRPERAKKVREQWKQQASDAQLAITMAEKEQRHYIKNIGRMILEIESLEDAEKERRRAASRAAAGAGPGGESGAIGAPGISITQPGLGKGARAAEPPRPEFVGLQEMHRRLATAGSRRAENLARMQFDLLQRTASDTERSRQALENMARTSTTPPASVIP